MIDLYNLGLQLNSCNAQERADEDRHLLHRANASLEARIAYASILPLLRNDKILVNSWALKLVSSETPFFYISDPWLKHKLANSTRQKHHGLYKINSSRKPTPGPYQCQIFALPNSKTFTLCRVKQLESEIGDLRSQTNEWKDKCEATREAYEAFVTTPPLPQIR